MRRLLVLLVAAGGVLGWLYWRGEILKKPTEGPLTLYGNVDVRELTLGFRVPGRIEAMLKEEGDRVAAGEILARLDARPYEEELAVREAQIRETEAGLLNSEKNLSRLENLLRNRSLAQSDYDAALAVRDELKARLDTVKAQRAASLTSLGDTLLSSPAEGTILTRDREGGSVVAAGEIVYTVSLDRPVWIRAYLDEPDLGLVRPGQAAVVSTDSGGTYRARVAHVSPRAEFTPRAVETPALRTDLVFRLKIVVDEPDEGLRQGMPVTVVIPEGGRGDGA